MRASTSLSLVALALGALASLESPVAAGGRSPIVNRACDNSAILRNYGVVLFRAFDPQDVFGPLELLQLVSHQHHMNLYLLADTLDPVTTEPASAAMNPKNSSFSPIIQPSHTFADDPDLDVLIVPGGPGVRSPELNSTLDYITRTYPKVKYLITICTGSGLVAKTGILNGKRATTNKTSWPSIIPMGPLVKWVAPARWVVDGNIWSSSGITAGIDCIFAFVKTMYPDGQALFDEFAKLIEYQPHEDPCWDPFAAMNNITSQNQPDCK
ncbi:isonitrile hydratase 3 [Phialemonium atrogriseum]|uniref:Isonitrile hydratase 3 n=1 Tax=Phialemonium atrogriseum TaxID=1093897 RepID=A0AAJ0CA41_9PEZI|nr:isonitrile hydratase 3 [Phialemonium atrogriseum]KAK1772944.1 isonitrile hydratase 3 [Phialemonium atrogriseum]